MSKSVVVLHEGRSLKVAAEGQLYVSVGVGVCQAMLISRMCLRLK